MKIFWQHFHSKSQWTHVQYYIFCKGNIGFIISVVLKFLDCCIKKGLMDDVFHAHNVKKQNVDNDKENSYCMHGMRTLIMLLNQHYFLNKQAYCCRSSFCLLHYIIAFRVFLAWYLIQLFTLPWPNYHYAADNLQTKSQQKDLQFTFSLAGCSCQRCYYTIGRLNVFTFPWLNKIELKASCRSPAYVLQTFQTSDLQACWMRSNRLKKDQSADLLVPYGVIPFVISH